MGTALLCLAVDAHAVLELTTESKVCSGRQTGIPQAIQQDKSRIPGDAIDRVEWLDFDGDGRCDLVGFIDPQSRRSGADGFFYRRVGESLERVAHYADMTGVLAFYPRKGGAPYLLTFDLDGRPNATLFHWDTEAKKLQFLSYWRTRENAPEVTAVMATYAQSMIERGKQALIQGRPADAGRDFREVPALLGAAGDSGLLATAAYYRSVSSYLEDNLAEAYRRANEAIRYNAELAVPYYMHGVILEAIAQDPQARAALGRDPRAALPRGDAELKKEILAAYRKFIALAPADPLKDTVQARIADIEQGRLHARPEDRELLRQLGLVDTRA